MAMAGPREFHPHRGGKMKTNHVLVILGSPRKKGNSAILAQQISQGAISEKAEVETIYLHGKNIAPCKACMTCQKKGSKGCSCLLYTSDAADDLLCVDLGGRRIITKKNKTDISNKNKTTQNTTTRVSSST